MTAVYVVLAVLIALGWWYVDLHRHPTRRCPSCKGSGKNAGSTRLRWGECPRCQGRGHVPRLGARKELWQDSKRGPFVPHHGAGGPLYVRVADASGGTTTGVLAGRFPSDGLTDAVPADLRRGSGVKHISACR